MVVYNLHYISERSTCSYISLFQGTEIENCLQNVNCERVTEDECDKLPSILECEEAIYRMKNNKSPCQDGVTSELKKTFLHDIKEFFLFLAI